MNISSRTCLLAAILALSASMQCAYAHTFFTAEIEGTDGNATFIGYTHSGRFFYNLTSDTLGDVVGTELVDGNPNNDFATLVTLKNPVPSNSTEFLGQLADGYTPKPPAFAYFSPEDVNATALPPAVYGGIYDLFQLACKDQLLLSIETDTAQLSAQVKYSPPADDTEGKTCEEAAQPYKAAAPSPAPTTAPSSGTGRSVASLAVALAAVLAVMVL